MISSYLQHPDLEPVQWQKKKNTFDVYHKTKSNSHAYPGPWDRQDFTGGSICSAAGLVVEQVTITFVVPKSSSEKCYT